MKEDDSWNDVDSGWEELEEVIDPNQTGAPVKATPSQPIARSDSGEFSEESDTVDYTEEEVPEEVAAFLGHRPEPKPTPVEEPAPQVVLSLQDLARRDREEDADPAQLPTSRDGAGAAEPVQLPGPRGRSPQPPALPPAPGDPGKGPEDQTAPYPTQSLPEDLSAQADEVLQDWTGPEVVLDRDGPAEPPMAPGESPGYSMVVLALLALAALVSVAAVVYFVFFS